MKTLFLLIIGLPVSLVAQAQHLPAQQVPATAVAAFEHTFPAATKAAWRQKDVAYEVSFEQKQVASAALFTPTGALVETQTEVSYQDLPPLARTALMQQFPHREVDKVMKVVSATGAVSYAALVCRGKDKDCQASRFDPDGRSPTSAGPAALPRKIQLKYGALPQRAAHSQLDAEQRAGLGYDG